MAEYAHIVIGSAIFLFFLGWLELLARMDNPWSAIDGSTYWAGWFIIKTISLIFFLLGKWTLPRFRYDQVMDLGWTKLLPLALANLIFYIFVVTWLDQSNLNLP